MSRPRKIDAALVARAQAIVAKPRTIRELRAAQAVLLPAVAQATLEQTATVLGVGRATVARYQAAFRQEAQEPPGGGGRRPWGGRRRALLSPTAEKEFLAGWETRARAGELVVLSAVRTALSAQVGQRVAPSVLYRLMARHGWRKVAPDTRHPKTDEAQQAEWKKKRYRTCWQPS